MASPPSFGLGGGTNHSLRDVGKAEPRAEVDRPIVSQGINVDMRSLFELPVTQNPHIVTNLMYTPRALFSRLFLKICLFVLSIYTHNIRRCVFYDEIRNNFREARFFHWFI